MLMLLIVLLLWLSVMFAGIIIKPILALIITFVVFMAAIIGAIKGM